MSRLHLVLKVTRDSSAKHSSKLTMICQRLSTPAARLAAVLASGTCLGVGDQPLALAAGASATANYVTTVLDHGAAGNGRTLDTAAINQAIEVCAKAGGGQVRLPPGRYLSGTIHLRSHVTLLFDAGATLVGTTNLAHYHQPAPPSFMPEARWGKWHRGLIIGENVEDFAITGQGVIDGNKVFDPTGEERMRGPHTIVLINCRHFDLRDVSIVDSANYAVFFQASDQVNIRNVKISGGWDGVHFRGAPGRDCHDVNILGCQFYTGDDSIAGRYWDNVVVSGCIVNSSCNGIRLIGPARRLIIHDCLFYGPGLQPHRTSGAARRSNMLSGIILQPGAWDKTQGPLDEVFISGVTMRDIASPITLWTKPGNTAGRVTVSGLNATGVYRSAASVESWADAPITNFVFRGVNIEFEGGGEVDQARRPVIAPGVDSRPLPAWGFYARNAEQVTLEDVRFSCTRDDYRPVLMANNVRRLNLDNFKFTRVPGVTQPLLLTNIGKLNLRDTDLPLVSRP
jgi:hypothetical protein